MLDELVGAKGTKKDSTDDFSVTIPACVEGEVKDVNTFERSIENSSASAQLIGGTLMSFLSHVIYGRDCPH